MKQATPIFVQALLLMATPVASTAGDGVVALQTADPACGDNSAKIYVDCGNGTVTDNRTGLVWLANADCFGQMSWADAVATVSGLSDLDCGEAEEGCDCGLEDGSSPGEWRLPSRKEWGAMTADAITGGCSPAITSDVVLLFGDACWDQSCVDNDACSFLNVQSAIYWAANTRVVSPTFAYLVQLDSGWAGGWGFKPSSSPYVWPVRAGQ